MLKFKEKKALKKCCKIFGVRKLIGNFIKEGKEGGGENILTSRNKRFMVYVYILKGHFQN